MRHGGPTKHIFKLIRTFVRVDSIFESSELAYDRNDGNHLNSDGLTINEIIQINRPVLRFSQENATLSS